MRNILILSEDYLKTNSGLNENVFGKTILPAIREAQDIELQTIIGESLYNAILDKISTNTLVDAYKTLVDDYCRPYVMYMTLAGLVDGLANKMGNIGVVRSRDEYVDNLSDDERDRVFHSYVYKADFYGRRLQEFLLNNRQEFPELDDCACESIKAHLNSAASTGLWLGGLRGKKIR